MCTRIAFHRHYCTRIEKERINKVLAEELYPQVYLFTPQEGTFLYEKGMKTVGIILKINDWEMDRHFKGQTDSLATVMQQYEGREKQVYFMDMETQKISRYTVDTDTLEGKIVSHSMYPPVFKKVVNELQLYKANEKVK